MHEMHKSRLEMLHKTAFFFMYKKWKRIEMHKFN